MLQAPMLDGLSLDPFSLSDDGLSPAEVGIGERHVAQALMVALVVVVLDGSRPSSELIPKVAQQLARPGARIAAIEQSPSSIWDCGRS